MMNSDAVSNPSPRVDLGALDSRTGGREAGASETATATGFTLALPAPPSVNRFMRRLGNKSPEVVKWSQQCDKHILMTRPRPTRVHGHFVCTIMWDGDGAGYIDIDNRIKPLLDYLQRVELIDDDKLCWRLHVGWGAAPLGCVVHVQPTKGML